ncbi:MAG TPA: 16S rRNA (adenine(1518)-N(6)/adenine(1519)-N(6))-dimethyltransferase RsmA [Leucothrix mucor]|nr:16S rRNA (adenine(1518)-N(6)/adenine(1519)-N(6))-dimethyltransferase RsmA [Leucothrix mucor]
MANYKTKKRFGQHFLHDGGVIQKIIHDINPQASERFVEIGPGLGALTFPLLEKIDALDVVEIDRDVIARLEQYQNKKLTIHSIDALKFDLSTLSTNPSSGTAVSEKESLLRVVGNLPYNISTPLIFHLLEYAHLIKDMHFMLQNEVVQRITAPPHSKTYGRLSVMVQYYCETKYLLFVSPESFKPPPKVDSAILRLTPWKKMPYKANDETYLSKLVAQAFSMRRKTLRNTLKKMLSSEQIESAGIDPSLRPENISVAEYVTLSNLTPIST